MGIEIERKYLVKSDEWKSSGVKKLYQQGYLLIDKTKTIRVRTIEDTAYLTCLLYTSDAADERSSVDLGGRRIIKKKKTVEYDGTRTINISKSY